MFWGLVVAMLIFISLVLLIEGRAHEKTAGVVAGVSGVFLLILGIIIICNTSVVTKTVYSTAIPGVGQLTKTKTYATGIRCAITLPCEENETYTLTTKRGKVDIDSDDAEKLLAAK
jgi:hypothetical protein